MKKYFSVEKKSITHQLNAIKNIKVDPNNIVLNAAAFQDQLSRQFGLYKPYRRSHIQISSRSKPISKPVPKRSLVQQLTSSKQTEKEILNRNKKFLSNLTFAERTGIQKISSFPLSLEQWKELEAKTIKREDFKGECPICMDKLSSRESVILSCSHVFHKICLHNFEKLTTVSKCPLCRCERYESKTYTKDKEYYVRECVIIIQTNYRGYITRYKLYMNVFRKDMPKNKHLRSIYSYWKIKELTKIMCNAITKQNEKSRLMLMQAQKDNEELIKMENKNREARERNRKEGGTDWEGVVDKMKHREGDVCAICFCGYGNKALYILDCSHCFHKNCLDSFERFDPYYIKRCPICRQNYKKKEIKNK